MSWDDLNENGPCGHVFAGSAYLDLIERTFRGRIVESKTDSNTDQPQGAVRNLARRSPLVFRAVVPPFTAYSAFLLERMPTEAETHGRSSTIERLLQEIEQQFSAADLHLPPSLIDVRTFSWRKWAVRPLYTYRIKLGESATSTNNWSESARRIARKEAETYDIVEPDPATVASLSTGSYKRTRRPSPLSTRKLTTFLSEAADPAGLGARLVGARHTDSGEVEAAIAILRHGSTAYYWIAGGLAGPAMTVLLGDILPKLADEGFKIFDFVGANTDSIAEFKRRFGGHLTTYFRAVWRKGLLPAVEDAIRARR